MEGTHIPPCSFHCGLTDVHLIIITSENTQMSVCMWRRSPPLQAGSCYDTKDSGWNLYHKWGLKEKHNTVKPCVIYNYRKGQFSGWEDNNTLFLQQEPTQHSILKAIVWGKVWYCIFSLVLAVIRKTEFSATALQQFTDINYVRRQKAADSDSDAVEAMMQ